MNTPVAVNDDFDLESEDESEDEYQPSRRRMLNVIADYDKEIKNELVKRKASDEEVFAAYKTAQYRLKKRDVPWHISSAIDSLDKALGAAKKAQPDEVSNSIFGDVGELGASLADLAPAVVTECARLSGTEIIIGETPSEPGRLNVERARDLLARCVSTDEVKNIRDKAEAVALYQRAQKASIEAQNDAAEIMLVATRRLGELTRQMAKRTGGHAAKARSQDGTELADAPKSLAELGIDKRESHRWEKLAAIPEPTFKDYIKAARACGERLTVQGALRAANGARQRKPKPANDSDLDDSLRLSNEEIAFIGDVYDNALRLVVDKLESKFADHPKGSLWRPHLASFMRLRLSEYED